MSQMNTDQDFLNQLSLEEREYISSIISELYCNGIIIYGNDEIEKYREGYIKCWYCGVWSFRFENRCSYCWTDITSEVIENFKFEMERRIDVKIRMDMMMKINKLPTKFKNKYKDNINYILRLMGCQK